MDGNGINAQSNSHGSCPIDPTNRLSFARSQCPSEIQLIDSLHHERDTSTTPPTHEIDANFLRNTTTLLTSTSCIHSAAL